MESSVDLENGNKTSLYRKCRKGHNLWCWENMGLRGICGPQKKEMRVGWRN